MSERNKIRNVLSKGAGQTSLTIFFTKTKWSSFILSSLFANLMSLDADFGSLSETTE